MFSVSEEVGERVELEEVGERDAAASKIVVSECCNIPNTRSKNRQNNDSTPTPIPPLCRAAFGPLKTYLSHPSSKCVNILPFRANSCYIFVQNTT